MEDNLAVFLWDELWTILHYPLVVMATVRSWTFHQRFIENFSISYASMKYDHINRTDCSAIYLWYTARIWMAENYAIKFFLIFSCNLIIYLKWLHGYHLDIDPASHWVSITLLQCELNFNIRLLKQTLEWLSLVKRHSAHIYVFQGRKIEKQYTCVHQHWFPDYIL